MSKRDETDDEFDEVGPDGDDFDEEDFLREEEEEDQDAKQVDAESGGRGLLTLAGLGSAFLFILMAMLIKGGILGIKQGVDAYHNPADVPPAPQELARERAETHKVITKSLQRQQDLYDILMHQKQHGLTDDDLDAVLKTHWKSQNQDSRMEPWRAIAPSMDWRVNVDWDVPQVKQLIETYQANKQARIED